MTVDQTWSILVLDDDKESSELLAKSLHGQLIPNIGKLSVTTLQDFDRGLVELEASRYDLIVLDVRLGPISGERIDESGIVTMEEIKRRRFLPIIFYTALPNKVRHLETPLVRVVEKSLGPSKVLDEIKFIFGTNLPLTNREFMGHLEDIQRDYMWNFVAPNWAAFESAEDKSCVAYLLARRLAKSLDGPSMSRFAERLAACPGAKWNEDKVHPVKYYIIPPISDQPLAGGVYVHQNGASLNYLVLITPSCDIAQKKAETMLFAQCKRLADIPEFTEWKNDQGNDKLKGKLWQLLENRGSDRYFFLPGVFDIPDLVMDYQRLTIFALDDVKTMLANQSLICKASVDSPYCELLLSRFSRYFGRLGVPDLNVDIVAKKF